MLTFLTVPDYAFYPLAVGAPPALLYATRKINLQIPEKEQKEARKVWIILGCLLMILSLNLSLKPRSAAYVPITRTISEFIGRHPGRYAMSTGAGLTSFETKTNIVRLDGSAEDQFFLKQLDVQNSLNKVFQHYAVNYYIVLNPSQAKDCYSVREPAQNRFGGMNKGLSDWICARPVFEKQATPQTNVAVFQINSSEKELHP